MTRLEAIEDAVQMAFERALGTWSRRGLPTEPSAWFTRVATDGLRSERVASEYGHDLSLLESRSVRLDDGVEDWLSLLFACADERLVPRVRLVLCRKRLAELTTLETDERGATRLQTVQQALYLQFNEGYSLGPDADLSIGPISGC